MTATLDSQLAGAKPGYYRIFDLIFQSVVFAPGLLKCRSATADLTVEFRDGELVSEDGFNWIHDWKSNDSTVVMTCKKRGNEYLLRFPQAADFLIQLENKTVRVFPNDGISNVIIMQLLQDQVIPRMLSHMGRLVLHASAAVVRNGQAVAFLGDTGRGKSTLAASYYQAGNKLITDDCLLVESHATGVLGIPAYPGLRLWPDSARALQVDSGRKDLSETSRNKIRVTLEKGAYDAKGVPLSAIFLLGEAVESRVLRVEPVHGSSVIMAIIEAAFVLDLVSPDTARRNFAAAGEIARSGIPIYQLDYPRQYDALPAVRSLVKEVVSPK